MSGVGVHLSCFALSIVSALVPWVNGEVLLLSLSALVTSPLHLAALVILASAGQMLGKCVLYWAGRGVIPLKGGRVSRIIDSWRGLFERASTRQMGLVFVSSALGIPPFYVITILAGAFRIRFGRFIAVGTCGRLVRFSTLILVPNLGIRIFHAIVQ